MPSNYIEPSEAEKRAYSHSMRAFDAQLIHKKTKNKARTKALFGSQKNECNFCSKTSKHTHFK